MSANDIIKTRVTSDIKRQVAERAQDELLSESLWLRRLIDAALRDPSVNSHAHRQRSPDPCHVGGRRLQIRVRPDDRLLLHARADARGMPAATYVAVVLRSHLRNLAPLPRDELAALKRSNAELGAIGRNLNQVARVAHQTGRITGPSHDDLRAMLKVCEVMRDHVRALIRANTTSWEVGYAEARD